jgi:hypothetical protein
MATWTHLVRLNHKGVPTFAQLVAPKEDGDLDEQFEVNIATGDPVFNNIVLTGEIVTVGRNTLLAPFATVPIVINTGLNYKDHVTESLFYSTPVSSLNVAFWKDITQFDMSLIYHCSQSLGSCASDSLYLL